MYKKEPLLIIFGTGFGSEFYSLGTKTLISSTEWSLLDLYRKVGMFFTGIFMLFLGKILINKKISIYKRTAGFAYLIIALTNPLLYTTTAYLAYVYIASDMVK